MIKCKNACPVGKFDGCCCECPPEHADLCDTRCNNEPQTCGESTFEGTDLQVFNHITATAVGIITDIAKQKKRLEESEKVMKEQLLKAMEKYNVKSFENDFLKFTYIAETTRNTVDSAKLKKLHPDIHAECSKTSPVKASVRVKAKDDG